MGELSGRRILVSGGSSGLGAALVRAAVAAGARVGVLARRADRLDALAAETGVSTAVCDIGDADAAQAAVTGVADALGGLDGVVNAAGLMLHSRLSAGVTDDWARMVQVNILGTMHVTQAALPYLRRAELADLMMISSTAQDGVTTPDFAMYSATKAAVPRLVEALRMDLADSPQIRVTNVKPGYIRDGGLGPGIRDERLRAATEDVMNRIGMSAAAVAGQLVHLLALPAELNVREITLAPTARP
jgi:NADP-dependent 3-hydroxy acid dehydrogenase YdfG